MYTKFKITLTFLNSNIRFFHNIIKDIKTYKTQCYKIAEDYFRV